MPKSLRSHPCTDLPKPVELVYQVLSGHDDLRSLPIDRMSRAADPLLGRASALPRPLHLLQGSLSCWPPSERAASVYAAAVLILLLLSSRTASDKLLEPAWFLLGHSSARRLAQIPTPNSVYSNRIARFRCAGLWRIPRAPRKSQRPGWLRLLRENRLHLDAVLEPLLGSNGSTAKSYRISCDDSAVTIRQLGPQADFCGNSVSNRCEHLEP